jgi:hypothetical protein
MIRSSTPTRTTNGVWEGRLVPSREMKISIKCWISRRLAAIISWVGDRGGKSSSMGDSGKKAQLCRWWCKGMNSERQPSSSFLRRVYPGIIVLVWGARAGWDIMVTWRDRKTSVVRSLRLCSVDIILDKVFGSYLWSWEASLGWVTDGNILNSELEKESAIWPSTTPSVWLICQSVSHQLAFFSRLIGLWLNCQLVGWLIVIDQWLISSNLCVIYYVETKRKVLANLTRELQPRHVISVSND